MTQLRSGLLLLGLLDCSKPAEPAGPPPGFEYAYAGPSCAPWDGYAVSLVLRGAPLAPGDSVLEGNDAPELRVAVYPRGGGGDSPSGLRRATYRWPESPEVAAGSLCANGPCAASPSGRITVQEIGSDGALRGHLDLRLADGRTIRGRFAAEWRPRQQFCG